MTKQETPERPFFYREDGAKVYIQTISLLELNKAEEGITAEFRARGEPIDPPKYKVKTVGGGEIEMTMDSTNIEVEGDPEETERRKSAWIKHLVAVNKLKEQIGDVTTDIVMEGIIADPPSPEWIEKKRKRHITIPDDPDELLTLYKMVEIIKTPGDLVKAQQEIILLSSSGAVKREDIEAAGATFLGKIQGIVGRPSGEVADSGSNGKEAAEEPLGTQHVTKRGRRHKGVGNTAKPDAPVLSE